MNSIPEKHQALSAGIAKSIIGQRSVVDDVLLTILCGGHALITGVPGLAKTSLIRTLSQCLDLSFRRIQFTPDLMPSDITGTDIIEEDPATGKRRIQFLEGPVFGNLILADEINRTPPKTQAAMLQTMQEHEVSVGNKTYPLPKPFHVFATQNPLEMEGTYTLPEAQADRFMFNIQCQYPTVVEEEEIVRSTTSGTIPQPSPILNSDQILEMQQITRLIPVSSEVISYAVQLASRSRPESENAPDYVREFVRWGASPRASQYLILGAKGRAAIMGAPCVDFDMVRSVAHQVMLHRIMTNFHARAQKVETTEIINRLLDDIPAK